MTSDLMQIGLHIYFFYLLIYYTHFNGVTQLHNYEKNKTYYIIVTYHFGEIGRAIQVH
jgi:hypothetical protein